jgi:hypothetical protein
LPQLDDHPGCLSLIVTEVEGDTISAVGYRESLGIGYLSGSTNLTGNRDQNQDGYQPDTFPNVQAMDGFSIDIHQSNLRRFHVGFKPVLERSMKGCLFLEQ